MPQKKRKRNCSFCGAQIATYAARQQAQNDVICCANCADLLRRAEQQGAAIRSRVINVLLRAQLNGLAGLDARAEGEQVLALAQL